MKLKSGIACFVGILASAPSFGAPIDVEIGGEYHFNLVHTDDGLKPDGSQTKETDFGVKAAKIALRGKLTDQLTWNVLYQTDKAPGLERYWITNKVSDQLDVSIGQQKIRTYGWHRRLSSSINPVRAAYLDYNPLKDVMAVDFAYKMGSHSLALTLAKDYFDTDATCLSSGAGCSSWNGRDVQKQPAVLLEWAGNYGGLQPMLQYAMYDKGKSATGSFGIRYQTDLIESYVDYTLDTRKAKGLDATTGLAEEQEKTINGLVVYGEYKAGSVSPFLHFSTLNVDDFTAAGVPEPDTNKDGELKDNEQTIVLGSYFENWGKLYRPYAALARYSGKYLKDAATNEKEDRSKLDVMLGLNGKF